MKMYSKGTRGSKQSSDWRFDCLLLPASLSGDIFSRRDREDESVPSRWSKVNLVGEFTADIKLLQR